MMDFAAARIKMVDNQIRTTDVTSHSVLNAFLSVPREAFVPANLRPLAYIDEDMQIAAAANGQPARYIMEPSPLAKLLQLGAITKDDLVLEIGCGGGYTAALLSQIAGSVVAVECDESLAAKATATLADLGYDNVAVVTGDLAAGYANDAPYDVIFINGAVEEVPQSRQRIAECRLRQRDAACRARDVPLGHQGVEDHEQVQVQSAQVHAPTIGTAPRPPQARPGPSFVL